MKNYVKLAEFSKLNYFNYFNYFTYLRRGVCGELCVKINLFHTNFNYFTKIAKRSTFRLINLYTKMAKYANYAVLLYMQDCENSTLFSKIFLRPHFWGVCRHLKASNLTPYWGTIYYFVRRNAMFNEIEGHRNCLTIFYKISKFKVLRPHNAHLCTFWLNLTDRKNRAEYIYSTRKNLLASIRKNSYIGFYILVTEKMGVFTIW